MTSESSLSDRGSAVEEVRTLRLLVDGAPNALIMVDDHGHIRVVNARTLELFGYGPDELVGQPVERLVPTRFRGAHPGLLAGYMSEPSTREMGSGRDLYAVRKDGSEFPVEIGLNPIVTAEGRFVMASIIDITERKRIETLARESEERFRMLVEAVDDYAILMLDPEGRIASWNAGAARITGYEAEEALGRHVREFYPIEDREAGRPERVLAEAARTGRSTDEGWRVRKDGRRYWASVATSAVRDPSGTLRGFAKVIRDLTERTETEREVREAEERFRLLVEGAPNAIVMVDRSGSITLVNSQTETLFGHGREELLGRRVETLVPERYRGGHPDLRQGFMGSPATRAMGAGRDLYGLRRDGSEVPIEIGLNPITTSQGTYVLASIIDITERKGAEEQIRASLREKEMLLGEVHHRVKNNLQVISSMLRMQAGQTTDPNGRAMFEECRDRVHSMALVHEMLYRSGHFSSVNFADHIRELAGQLVRSYARRSESVQLHLDVQDADMDIETAIPAGLILNELVSNALKHGFPGERGGSVNVHLARVDGGMLELTVSDDGVGLAGDFVPDESPTLGMTIIQSLARQVRGTVTFSSEGGTRVRVLFPGRADGREDGR